MKGHGHRNAAQPHAVPPPYQEHPDYAGAQYPQPCRDHQHDTNGARQERHHGCHEDVDTGEQDATSTGLAIERVEELTHAGLHLQSASGLLVKEVLKLIEDNETRRVCCISSIEGIENSIRLILWGQAGQIRPDFPTAAKILAASSGKRVFSFMRSKIGSLRNGPLPTRRSRSA